jgi:hypothetical protein
MGIGRQDWIEAGYRELARAGERGVTINALAARLEVTKGSFYWHSTDEAELRALLMLRTWVGGYLVASGLDDLGTPDRALNVLLSRSHY